MALQAPFGALFRCIVVEPRTLFEAEIGAMLAGKG